MFLITINLPMRTKRNIFLSILLFFTFACNSAFAINEEEFKNASDCGVENTVVKFFSWDICEQDFAFRIFYKLFPDVMEEQILPIVNSKYLEKVKGLETNNLEMNRAYQHSMLKIMEIMFNLSMVFGSWLFLWHTGLALLRTATEGSFLGKEYNATKTGIKYGVIIFLMLPAGNGLIIGHWLVFLLILFSIAFGNLFYGIFLNFIDAGSDAANLNAGNNSIGTFKDTSEDRLAAFKDYAAKNSMDHNFFYGTEMAKKLTKASVCKVRTEQFILENNLTKINSANSGEYFQCSSESAAKSQILNSSLSGASFVNTGGAFTSYRTTETNIKNGSSKVSFTSGVRFGKNIQGSTCQNIDGIYSYSCGELTVSVPNITDGDTIDLMNDIGFYSIYSNVSNAITSNYKASSTSVTSTATAGWESISSKLVEKLGTEIGGKKQLSPSDEVIIKNISYIYHQLLLNDAMVGVAATSGNNIVSPSTNVALVNNMRNTATAAGFIIDAYCIKNQEMIKNSKNLLKYFNGFKKEDDKTISSSCTKLIGSQPKDFYGIEFNQDKAGTAAATVEINNKTKLAKERLLDVVLDVQYKREGLELSLFKSLKSVSKLSLTAQMRKVGFASAGGFMLKIIKDKDIDNKFMRSLQNSIGFNDANVDNKFIGSEVTASKSNQPSSLNNSNFADISFVYGNVMNDFSSGRKDLRMTDISPIVSGVYDDSLSQAGRDDDYVNSILTLITDPFSSFKTAIGVKAGSDGYEDIVKKCMEDIKLCPIPLENPIKGLSDYGQTLIAASTNLMATSIVLSFTKYAKVNYQTKKILREKGGAVNAGDKLESVLDNVASKSGGVGGKFAGFIAKSFNLAEALLNAMMGVFLLLLSIGVFLAYIIPLVPFMMFTFAFLSWVTICLLTIFIAPMWIIFNLKLTEERNGNSEMYRSGYNIAMQILFRPSLLIIALVLGWGIFILAFLILNLTITPFIYGVLMSSGGSFSLVSLLNGLMIILTYGIIVYVIIKFVFNMMYEITNKMFQAMNVTPIDDKANVADEVTRSAVLASVINFKVLQSLSNNVKKEISKNTASNKRDVAEANRDTAVDDIVKTKVDGMAGDKKPDHNE